VLRLQSLDFLSGLQRRPALPALVGRAFEVGTRLTDDLEVIVVNDGSQDDTDAVLAELQQRFGPRLRVVRHAVNRGYGGALRSGFQAATRDFVFYTDGDGQYDVADR
jgi:glycosyltransferase involved in cell wall biosynthesis